MSLGMDLHIRMYAVLGYKGFEIVSRCTQRSRDAT